MKKRRFLRAVRATKIADMDHLFEVERLTEKDGWVWIARVRIFLDVEVLCGGLKLEEVWALRTNIPQIRFAGEPFQMQL
jgi:hypothetical protein